MLKMVHWLPTEEVKSLKTVILPKLNLNGLAGFGKAKKMIGCGNLIRLLIDCHCRGQMLD
jgi:hypothetical protein